MSIKLLALAFEKAEKEIGSSKKTHLARHLSDLLLEDYKYIINERTLRDYYTSYKNKENDFQDDLKPKLIKCLCRYLGFKDYADFINQKEGSGNIELEEEEEESSEIDKKEKDKKKRRWIITISISVVFAIIFVNTPVVKDLIFKSSKPIIKTEGCMTWADSLYVAVSCDEAPLSKYGTDVKPLDQMEMKNMKKVEVDAAYEFFFEGDTEKPLIWYYKTKEGEIEYFTAPGLHPVNDKTLRKITKGIIEKYVPIHKNREDSFVQ